MDNQGRPTKRRRVDMPLPDGFAVSKPAKPNSKISLGRYVPAPAFTQATSESKAKLKKKETISSGREHEQIAARRAIPGTNNGRTGGAGGEAKAGPAAEANATVSSAKSGDSAVEIQRRLPIKPKPLVKIDPMAPLSKLAKLKVNPNLRPAPPPPKPPSVASSSSVKLRTSTSHELVPTAKRLNVFELPLKLNQAKNKKDETNYRPLSSLTTSLLNNEDLAMILLRAQHPELASMTKKTPLEILIERGMGLSPRKKDRHNKPKLRRGGLAATAAAIIDQSHTGHMLWKKEIEHNSRNLANAELCASILKILHSTSAPTAPCIALCRLIRPNGKDHPNFKSKELYRVVFTLPSHTNDQINNSAKRKRFAVGQSVLMFKPLQDISLSFDEEEKNPYDRLPASLPLPLSVPYSTPDPLDAPVSTRGILCTRFYVTS
ncbi:hypothetical protein D9613_003789 [Agrocybe pediades]|uniref:Uncharacterized protein n=1 Tax=Agrocybe pediades TaxID=84607 RepID=A0A8H4QI88_9AGAR|nr:hypothetical protein D9613_003789 [Agrocybe pediades]